ncbi:MAG: hypothetical protein ACLP07_06605 [Terracidiphilus sp.]
MTSFEKEGPQERRPGLFIFAIFLLLGAVLAFIVGPHNFIIRALSILAILASVSLVRASNFHTRTTAPGASLQEADLNAPSGPGPLAWAISGALIPVLVLSYFLLKSDALNGGHAAWPADLFGGVAFACAIAWSYVAMKLTSGRR